MKKSIIAILTFLFLASCAQQVSQKGKVVYLDELDRQKTLKEDQRNENAKIVEEYKRNRSFLPKLR